jgi:uncharacterized protein (DUF2235 family)
MAKRLVVCCDGTWNDSDNGTGYTNVSRLAWAIKPVDERSGTTQIVFYQSGVGTDGDLTSRLGGGALGLGLSHNIRDAYAFVCSNYVAGDEIFLFGFSRGAYTARSIAGLIGYAGLLGKQDLDRFFELWDGYKEPDKGNRAAALNKFPARITVSIKVIGVWDTVGSLGIPADLERFDILNFRRYYGFHDTNLGARVEHAFHALALDERRKNFVPTLWTQTEEGRKNRQVLKQVWFAGVHSNVGGGYKEHGASDVPLAWMASEVEPFLGIDFGYLKLRRDLTEKWSLGQLHESFKGFFAKLPQQRREPFKADQATSFERVHASVRTRIDGKGLGADRAPYASVVLNGIDLTANSAALSAQEEGLRWKDNEVGTDAAGAGKAESFHDKLRRALGITA